MKTKVFLIEVNDCDEHTIRWWHSHFGSQFWAILISKEIEIGILSPRFLLVDLSAGEIIPRQSILTIPPEYCKIRDEFNVQSKRVRSLKDIYHCI